VPVPSADHERKKAILFLVLAALGWSLGGLLIKGIHWNPMAISGMRSMIGAFLMRAFFRNMKFTGSFHQVMGAMAYAGTVILYVVANKMTTAANAILLQYTAPIYVALFSPWFLGERSQRSDWVTIAVALGGMTLFFLDDLTVTAYWGNCAALASGFCFGWLTLFLRKQRGGSNIESLFLGNLLAAAIGIPFMFSGPSPDAAGWAGLLLLGVFQLGIPYVLYSLAIRDVTAVTAILVPMIEPVLNPIWVLLAIGERPGPMSILGGAIVLVSVTLRTLLPALQRRVA
jgi:drug/metabolite transporter (DMT)-like permease